MQEQYIAPETRKQWLDIVMSAFNELKASKNHYRFQNAGVVYTAFPSGKRDLWHLVSEKMTKKDFDATYKKLKESLLIRPMHDNENGQLCFVLKIEVIEVFGGSL